MDRQRVRHIVSNRKCLQLLSHSLRIWNKMHFRPKYAPEFVVLQDTDNQMVIGKDVVSGMKSCEIRSRFNGIALQNQPFRRAKWVTLTYKMGDVARRNGPYGIVIRLLFSTKCLVLSRFPLHYRMGIRPSWASHLWMIACWSVKNRVIKFTKIEPRLKFLSEEGASSYFS